MTTDLIERLRICSEGPYSDEIMRHAADTIERQAAEIERLRLNSARYMWLRNNQYVDYDCINAETPDIEWPDDPKIYNDPALRLDWVIDQVIYKLGESV